MGRITTIEEKLASLVERPFLNRNVFDPLNIEIGIKKQVEKEKKNILGTIIIPNKFTVIIDELVYGEYEPFLEIFEKTLQKSLHQWITEKGYESAHELTIQFKKGTLSQESFDVVAFYEQAEGRTSSCITPPSNPSSSLPKEEDTRGLSGSADEKVPVGTLILVKTGQRFAINDGETIIGRSEDCDITIQDPTVSEIHAYIYTMNSKVILEDLGSRNGTRINYEKISKRVLTAGDKIIIGDTELVLEEIRRNQLRCCIR